jgi:hypothetical protein
MSESYTIERVYKLYSDTTGDHIEVCPDSDGLNMIRLHTNSDYFGKCDITFEPEVALHVANMLIKAANDAKRQDAIDFPNASEQ